METLPITYIVLMSITSDQLNGLKWARKKKR